MGTIDEVFEWVDSNLFLWGNLSADGFDSSLYDGKPVEENDKGELVYALEMVKYTRILERTIAASSEDNCKYILRRVFRFYHIFAEDMPESQPPTYYPAYDIEGLKAVIYWDLIGFYGEVNQLCKEIGFEINEFCEYKILPASLIKMRDKPIDIKYERSPRAYTMAAMWVAVDAFFPTELSREKKAAFIEIVTGGNIENAYENPRKTYAYTARDKRISDKRGGKGEVNKILDLIGLKSE